MASQARRVRLLQLISHRDPSGKHLQSLRSRLIVLIALLGIAASATGALMVGLFYQSASAQAGQAEAQIARACDSIAAAYRFYSAQWSAEMRGW